MPANQYLNFGGSKASTSRTAPFLPDYLERYDPDAHALLPRAIMPETHDSEFSDDDLIRRNNEELVSTWGNLVNRVLTFTYRNFDGHVPEPGALRDAGRGAARPGRRRRSTASARASTPATSARGCVARLGFAQETNRYLNQEEPWKYAKDRPAGGRPRLYTALARHRGPEGRFLPLPAASRSEKLQRYARSHDGPSTRRLGLAAAGAGGGAAGAAAAVQEARPARQPAERERSAIASSWSTPTPMSRSRSSPRTPTPPSSARRAPASSEIVVPAVDLVATAVAGAVASATPGSTPPPAIHPTSHRLTHCRAGEVDVACSSQTRRRRRRRDRPRLLP